MGQRKFLYFPPSIEGNLWRIAVTIPRTPHRGACDAGPDRSGRSYGQENRYAHVKEGREVAYARDAALARWGGVSVRSESGGVERNPRMGFRVMIPPSSEAELLGAEDQLCSAIEMDVVRGADYRALVRSTQR
jgi:hypothetical protein